MKFVIASALSFILWLLLAMVLLASGESSFTARVQRELTAPTGGIIFWHLQGSGGLCSADLDSAAGKVISSFQGKRVRITIEEIEEKRTLQEVKR